MPTVATKPPADAPDPSDVPQYMSKAMTPEQLSAKYAELEQKLETDVNALHSALEKQGVNSRGTTDIFGREFEVPVDAEHKASQFSMMMVFTRFGNPHMRAFHASWFGFFSSFFSMFAAAPLTAYMKKKTSLNLNKKEIGKANIAAVSTNIVMRVIVGFMSDLMGPRRCMAFLLLITTPAIIGMMFVPKCDCIDEDIDGDGIVECDNVGECSSSAETFIAMRALIGIALATFVTCQVWCSQMFNKSIVGFANATSAGWGNLGGGVTNLLMPYIFLGFYSSVSGDSSAEKEDKAWRLCYLVPLGMHVISAFGVLSGRDLPDGNFKELEHSGVKQKSNGFITARTGLSNVNAWILTVTYGMCFGVELTMNSVAAMYFYDYHGLSPQISGLLASLYGLMNLFARSLGGVISDAANKKFGMRGRLWAMWIVQTIEGIMCCVMASVTLGMDSPFDRPKVLAWTKLSDPWTSYPHERDGYVPINASGIELLVNECGAKHEAPPPEWQQLYLGKIDDELRMIREPPFARDGAAADCIQHQSAVGLCVFIMILFSLCVQAAEGLHYGVVPYVSRPALGIVSGMVGAGGNLGAVMGLRSFFYEGDIRRDEGFLRLGFLVIGLTASLFFVYFPDKGGMLFPAGGLGKYDPQIIKPPADYRGADSMDFANNKDSKEKTSSTNEVAIASA